MQPYYSSYSRLLDYYFFFFLYSLSLPICGFLLSPLSLYFLDFSLSSSHSPSPPTLMVWWWQTWWMVSISQTSLSLSLSDLVGITMFVGVWWWVFGGGGCLIVAMVELENFLRGGQWIHFCVIFRFITKCKRKLMENFES